MAYAQPAFAQEKRGVIPHAPLLKTAVPDTVNQEVAVELLQAVGLEVDVAADGAAAVRMAGERDYALVLMDVQMPVLDGLAATRALRALPGRAHWPVLALTANAFAEDRQACLAAGMNDFLTKPLDPQRLQATLARHLRRITAT